MNTQKKQSSDLCLESPDKETIFVSIPKNASSFVSDWLIENGWISRRINSTDPKYVALVLRDPVDRWCSGIAQYIQGLGIQINEYTSAMDKIIFDVVDRFDDHTWPQHVFYEGVFPNRPKMLFRTDLDLQHTLKQHFRLQPPHTQNYNCSAHNIDKKQTIDYFKQQLQNPVLLDKIKQAHAQDYAFMDKAEFIHFTPKADK